ncbi:MAG: Mut7-C RNAse domain-containing protein [candidate division Zixibacteria bacterium]|nr:Mut7-C RNAse domain-containing protein [candidate division Zixibacteria bacterium]
MQNHLSPGPKFVCDDHLGKLARYLRVGGFDAAFDREMTNSRLLQIALDEERWILTRDRRLIERTLVRNLFFITHDHWPDQLNAVLTHFGLEFRKDRMFSRCLEDNGTIEPAPKEAIEFRVFPFTYQHHDDFYICPICRRVYWSGTHVEATIRRLERFGIMVS